MFRARRPPSPWRTSRLAGALLVAVLAAGAAHATPLDFIPVGDPLERELRLLDLVSSRRLSNQLILRRLHARPLERFELRGPGVAPADDPLIAPSLTRIERDLGRDVPRADSVRVPGTTPRLLQHAPDPDTRVEISMALEGGGVTDEHDSRFVSGTGVHARLGVQVDRLLAYSHLIFGQVDSSRTFADPIVANTDVTTFTEESYLAYAARSGRLAVQFGRSRWHWGPGDEASLMLSKTSAPLTGLGFRASVPADRLEFTALNSTLAATAGEQLAVHRLEWQARDGLRLGIGEAARYQSSRWEPLYAIAVIPYVLVQRILASDEPDSADQIRNNVMVSFDAAWRIAEGTRIYGELLVDDLHAKTAEIPNKLAYQVGLDGLGMVGDARASWNVEFTRLSRFVYTSYFGRSYEAQGAPLGFPTGPDSRRLRVRGALDFGPDWQLNGAVAQTDQGESGLGVPFVPGSPVPDVWRFAGVVTRARDLDVGARWWPASGVDLEASVGWRWVENAGHVTGADDDGARAAFALRLVR